MIRAAATAAVVALAAPAAAVEPWEGLWSADPEWCDGAGDGTPVRITVVGIEGLENRCDITNVSPIGIGQSWKVNQLCSGEGIPDRVTELFLLDSDGALIRYTEEGIAVRMIRCE